jgi:hypothetical protein
LLIRPVQATKPAVLDLPPQSGFEVGSAHGRSHRDAPRWGRGWLTQIIGAVAALFFWVYGFSDARPMWENVALILLLYAISDTAVYLFLKARHRASLSTLR